jgi:ubiquitin C-terminal hydrolase
LAAVTAHLGDVNDGHYVTYRRFDPPDSRRPAVWLYTSDNFVNTVTIEEVLSCKAYMLFYERCPAGFEFEPMVESIIEESVKNIVL